MAIKTSDLLLNLRSTLSSVQGANFGRRLSLDKGNNEFYVILPSDDIENYPLMISVVQHSFIRKGMFGFQAIDLDWLRKGKNVHILSQMKEREVISNEDIELTEKYGDPFTRIYKHFKASGDIDTYKEANIRSINTLIHVFHQGEYKYLQCSQAVAKNIIQLIEVDEDIVYPDKAKAIRISGSGEGLARRYLAPIVLPKSEPPNVGDELRPCNLYDVLADRCHTYVEKVYFARKYYKDLLVKAGLKKCSDFGVSHALVTQAGERIESKYQKTKEEVKEIKKKKAQKVEVKGVSLVDEEDENEDDTIEDTEDLGDLEEDENEETTEDVEEETEDDIEEDEDLEDLLEDTEDEDDLDELLEED